MSTCEVKSLLFPPTRPFDSLTGDILTLIFKYLPWSSEQEVLCEIFCNQTESFCIHLLFIFLEAQQQWGRHCCRLPVQLCDPFEQTPCATSTQTPGARDEPGSHGGSPTERRDFATQAQRNPDL